MAIYDVEFNCRWGTLNVRLRVTDQLDHGGAVSEALPGKGKKKKGEINLVDARRRPSKPSNGTIIYDYLYLLGRQRNTGSV